MLIINDGVTKGRSLDAASVVASVPSVACIALRALSWMKTVLYSSRDDNYRQVIIHTTRTVPSSLSLHPSLLSPRHLL